MNMFWNQNELGHQSGVKKVKKSEGVKTRYWTFWLKFQQSLENRKIRQRN